MDVAKVISEGFDHVKTYIDRGFESLVPRLEKLEASAPQKGDPGEDGKDGAPGKDAPAISRGDIEAVVESSTDLFGRAVADYLAKNPPAAGAEGRPGKDGLNGKDAPAVDRDDIFSALKSNPSIIAEAVASYLVEHPPAPGKDGMAGKDGIAGEKGAPGRDGKDGASIISAVIDREGCLLLNLADGKALNLGLVVGKDGTPGADGRDGFGFDDVQVDHDGERSIKIVFARGDAKKEFPLMLATLVDRGVWREGRFKAGDSVSWEGSLFIAQQDTEKKPGTPESGWRLAAKRGRDGASAFDIAKRAGFKGSEADWIASLHGKQGPEGRPGRDLTQLGFDGRKS